MLLEALLSDQLIINEKTPDHLEPGYYRDLYATWKSRTLQEQTEYLESLGDEETVGFLQLMLGNPRHTLQIQNRHKFSVFALALEVNPDVFILKENTETDWSFPTWIDLAVRFNLHEDGTSNQVIGMIYDRFYPGEKNQSGWQQDYEEYQRRLVLVEGSKGN